MRDEPDGAVYYAPDAAVLLSDDFARDHCFGIVLGAGEQQGAVGLTFEPHPRRSVPEVAGTLWLDRETAELRTFEYRYVNVDRTIAAADVGGQLEFRQLPSGGWIVWRWSIRTPRLMLVRGSRFRGVRPADRDSVIGVQETGGAVVAVRPRAGDRASAAPVAIVTGVVYDSTRTAPMAGVQVALAGTPYTSVTDDAGRFRLAAPLSGSYRLTYAHPRIDMLRLQDTEPTWRSRRGGPRRRILRSPRWRSCASASVPHRPDPRPGAARSSASFATPAGLRRAWPAPR